MARMVQFQWRIRSLCWCASRCGSLGKEPTAITPAIAARPPLWATCGGFCVASQPTVTVLPGHWLANLSQWNHQIAPHVALRRTCSKYPARDSHRRRHRGGLLACSRLGLPRSPHLCWNHQRRHLRLGGRHSSLWLYPRPVRVCNRSLSGHRWVPWSDALQGAVSGDRASRPLRTSRPILADPSRSLLIASDPCRYHP